MAKPLAIPLAKVAGETNKARLPPNSAEWAATGPQACVNNFEP
jgi:hypothetical protein